MHTVNIWSKEKVSGQRRNGQCLVSRRTSFRRPVTSRFVTCPSPLHRKGTCPSSTEIVYTQQKRSFSRRFGWRTWISFMAPNLKSHLIERKKLFLNEVVIERGVNICSSHVDDSQRKMKKKKTFSLGLCAFACFLIKGVFGGYKRASRSVWALAATIPCSNRQEEGGCCWELKDVLWLWNIDVGYRTSFFLPRNVRVDGIRPFLPPFIVAIAQGQWKKLGNDTKAVSRTAVLSDTITFFFV